ncbi:hypothetical protein Hte_007286 [Hypoxylon texense]
MGTHGEINIGRDEPHANIAKFSGEGDEAFVKIYQELRISKGPGIQYMQCLEFLSGLASQDGFPKQVLASRESDDIESGALRQLEGNDLYKSWLQSRTNTLYLQGHLGLDAPRLLSQATNSDTIAISFRCDARDGPNYGPAQLFASLCYQILCLRPQLFDHVSELYKLYSEGTRWRPRLLVFFSSLLGCPFEGHTVCLIQHMDEMRNAKQLLKDIAALTSGAAKNFKLIVTAGSSTERSELFEPADAVVCIEPARHNIGTIVDSEINSLLSKRPSLSAAGDKIREMLRDKFTDSLELLSLPEPSIPAMINVWVMRLLDGAEPVTNSSIRRSELLMTTKVDDIYREILCRILPRRRQKARNALSWMAHACRPLRLNELAIATVFELDRKSIAGIEDETPVDLAWDINVDFGNLVQVDGGQIAHVRNSFRDYMLCQQPKGDAEWPFPLDSHRTIALKCLSYISLLAQQGPVELPKSTDCRSDLLSYSVRYWPSHYKEDSAGRTPDSNTEQGELQEFDVFFNDHDLMKKWAQLYFDSKPPGTGCRSSHPLAVSVEVGCSDLVRALLDGQMHTSDILTTALEEAIITGDEGLTRMLLTSGATSNIALHVVAMSGKPSLLELFHKTEDDLKSENPQGFTPLHCACQSGYLSMVEELLCIGLDAKAKSSITGQTPLHIACQFGHSEIIARLLEGDANANEEDKSGLTPLHVACKWQQEGSVISLFNKLKAGQSIDVNAQSQSSTTALHLAAESGRVDIVRLLFENHRDRRAGTDTQDKIHKLLRTKNADGSTPLHLAAASGHSEVVRELLRFETEEGPVAILDMDRQCCIPLHLAVKSGCPDVVQQLLGRENVVKDQIMSQASGWSGAFPIHLAVISGHFAIVKLLCKAHRKSETSLNLFNSSSLSPLHVAATSGQVDIVELLLEHNATATIFDSKNTTPLLLASRTGNVQIAKLLLDKGADPNAEDENGETPVLAAAEGGFASIVDLLLRNNANADTKSRTGWSLLMTAAGRGHIGVVAMLLKKRPELNATDNSGLSSLMLAAKGGHADITELLLTEGADPSINGPEGRKAIHFAAKRGDLKTTQLLLANPKVEINGVDSEGCTPLCFAVATGSVDVVNEFLHRGASITAEDEDGISPLDLEASEEVMEILLTPTNFNETAVPSHILDKALRQAATRGYLRVIRELNNRNASLETLDKNGRSLYHLAAENGCADVIKLLYELDVPGCDQTDNTKRTPASYASENGHLAAVKFLAEAAPESVRLPDQIDRTPLSYASGSQRVGVAEYLLESTDAVDDVNKVDSSNRTPLWFATKQGLMSTVQILLRHKADPNIADIDDASTPLHHAIRAGIPEMVYLLLDNNSSMEVRDGNGRTPLSYAAWLRHTEIVSILIDRDAPDTPDDEGWQALHAAYDSPEILKLLITRRQVDVNTTTQNGATVLHLAIEYGESVSVLLDSGADPLKQDSDGMTPLQIAAACGVDEEIFSLLLQKANGPLDVRDSSGRTDLVAAIEHHNRSAVELLLKTGQFVLGDVGKEEKSALDAAIGNYSSGVMDSILSHGGANISTESIEKILVWVLENGYEDVEQMMQILRDRSPKALAENHALFSLATKTDDISLAKFLLEFGSDSEVRDEHGWTLSQVVAAFESPADIPSSLDDKHSPPSQWSVDHSSADGEMSEENRLWLQYSSKSAVSDVEIVTARSDHPIPPSQRFYFEINVIKGSKESLGIGFGHSNYSKGRMPGWDDSSWGFHGNNGGMYHADGYWKANNTDWKYGTDDCVGCCIDPTQRKAFFTRNETVIGACFINLHGRLFPMVGFGKGAEIIANFGSDLASKPFRFPEGLTRNYRVSEEID